MLFDSEIKFNVFEKQKINCFLVEAGCYAQFYHNFDKI